MSIEASAWAWKIKLSAAQKLVLLALADHSDNKGICWPGKRGLGAKTGLCLKTIKSAIKDLEAAGYLVVNREHNDAKQHQTNRYHLMLDTLPPGVGATLPPGVGATLPWGKSYPTPGVRVTPPSNRHSIVIETTTTARANESPITEPVSITGPSKSSRCCDEENNQTPPPVMDRPSTANIKFPDIIPENARVALSRQLGSLDQEQASDVVAVLAARLTRDREPNRKGQGIESLHGYAAVLADRSSKGELQLPRPMVDAKKTNVLAARMDQLRQGWGAGMRIVVDGKVVHPDPWPYIRLGNGTATLASLIVNGAVVELRHGASNPQPMCASP